MHIYRMKIEEVRQWRRNHSVLVDSEGKVLRDATYAELVAGVRAQRAGTDPSFHIDGVDYHLELWRKRFAASLLAKYGPTQLRRNTGMILCTVRDPNAVEVPIGQTGSPECSPDPINCQCAEWAGRETGRHHIYCMAGQSAPEHQRATGMPPMPVGDQLPEVPEDDPLPGEPTIPEPNQCDCLTWDRADNMPRVGHHPACVHFKDWDEKQRPLKWLWTVDGDQVRQATRDEEDQAERNVQGNGVAILDLEGIPYIVGSEDWGKDELDRQERLALLTRDDPAPPEPSYPDGMIAAAALSNPLGKDPAGTDSGPSALPDTAELPTAEPEYP